VQTAGEGVSKIEDMGLFFSYSRRTEAAFALFDPFGIPIAIIPPYDNNQSSVILAVTIRKVTTFTRPGHESSMYV
jgi:hypothetical protein